MSYASEVLADGPSIWLRLNETSGTTAADSSGNGRDMTSPTAPTWNVASLLDTDADTAMTVTAGNQCPKIAAASWMFTSSYTVEAWIETTSTGVVVSLDNVAASFNDRRFFMGVALNSALGQPDGTFFLWVYQSGGSQITLNSASAINDGARHHIVARINDSTKVITLFVDDTVVDTESYTGTLSGGVFASMPLTIGTTWNSSTTNAFMPFNGTIDEVALYPTALSDARITAHYTAGTTGTPTTTDIELEHDMDFSHDVVFSNTFTIGHGMSFTHDADDLVVTSQMQVFHGIETFSRLVLKRPRKPDPTTGKAIYEIIVVDMQGNRIASLENATVGTYTQELNYGSTLEFTMKTTDPKIAYCRVPQAEVQFWRGGVLEDWLVLARARGVGNGQVAFTATSLDWYFTRRVVGKVPFPNLLKNGSFEQGEAHWNFTYLPGSIPALPPVHRIITTDTLNGTKALEITGADATQLIVETLTGDVNFAFDSSALTSTGIATINAICASIAIPNPKIRCEGHTDSNGPAGYNYNLGLARANSVKDQILSVKPQADVSIVSYGESRPVASNSTSGGRAANRRVTIRYKGTLTATGHQQYVGQSFTYTNPKSANKAKTLTLVGWCKITDYNGDSKTGDAVYIEAKHASDSKPIAFSSVKITKDTPRDRWVRMECAIAIPPDGRTYVVNTRMFPPDGTCIWDEIGVTASDLWGYYDKDQGYIVNQLVIEAQATGNGKSDLRILPGAPTTKVSRTREYPWIDRMQIWEALSEFPTLADGMDLWFEFTPTTRTLRAASPRRGDTLNYRFELGANVAAYSADIDGTQTATQVIVQADGEGSDREEGIYTDTSQMDGVIHEMVYNATPGSAVSSLISQAKRGVKRWGREVILPTLTMNPEFTDELLDNVVLGDVLPVKVQDGWVNIDEPYRVVGRSLDPEQDQITYTIVGEYSLR